MSMFLIYNIIWLIIWYVYDFINFFLNFKVKSLEVKSNLFSLVKVVLAMAMRSRLALLILRTCLNWSALSS